VLAAGVPVPPELPAEGQTSLRKALANALSVLPKTAGRKRRSSRVGFVLDAVFLSTADEAVGREFERAVLRLALRSGGCCFRPRSLEEAVKLMRAEQFIDLGLRSRAARAGVLASVRKWRGFSVAVRVALPDRPGDAEFMAGVGGVPGSRRVRGRVIDN
jgi:hypothetical protein